MNRNLMKKGVCFVNILMLLVSFAKPAAYARTQPADEKKDRYIIQTDNALQYSKIKKEFQGKKKTVANHKYADEEYLAESRSVVVEISKEEAKELADQPGVTVEKDHAVTAYGTDDMRETGQPVPIAIPAEGLLKQTPAEEYTTDPTRFEPCEPVTDPDKKDEVVPWNIACVAGTPSENEYRGKNVKVAVIDSGIDTHDELDTKGWADFSDRVEGYKPTDNSGHGTSMAGVISARLNGIGFEGIASEAELYSVKILDKENTASVSTVIKAIEWCIENKIDIINMSFGMNQYSTILADEIGRAHDNGILMVAAAGNDVKKVQYPAAYPEVISVGSVGKGLEESPFSKNNSVDLVAPGEEVQTTGYVGSYAITGGTSIAAAHVTGVAAAVKSADGQVTNETLTDILLSSGVALEDGSRLVSYKNAVAAIRNAETEPTPLPKLKRTAARLAEDGDAYVRGSWSMDTWADGSGTGHRSIINAMDLYYFNIGNGAASETEKTHNRWIVAESDYQADFIPKLSAGGAGTHSYIYDGVLLDGSTTAIYSPYHAKTRYSLYEVVQHLDFLYELARRRLVLQANLDMVAENYKGNTYYSNSIPLAMKRRIIVDIKNLYGELIKSFSGTGVDLTKVSSKGYMVLGLFLHLVQDMQAHRAKITKEMVFYGSNYATYYQYDQMGQWPTDSRINGKSMSGNYARSVLYNAIEKNGSIPIVRLKDLYTSNITVTVNGKTYLCSPALAYEDNPYFYRRRYETAWLLSNAYIERMKNNTGNTSTFVGIYLSFSDMPLYENACIELK